MLTPEERRRKNIKHIIISSVVGVAVIAASLMISDNITHACNVAYVHVRGDLFTYTDQYVSETTVSTSEEIVAAIDNAQYDSHIRAIILEVNSYGGTPLAGEEIANAIKDSEKPVVAYVRQAATSAAYWAISSADLIVASPNSDIGSIAVTSSYLDNENKNTKEGLNLNVLSTGKYKDMGNPNRTLSADEKALILRDLNVIHENFVQAVSVNRNIDVEKVKTMADGSSMLGEMALQNGLVDEVGGFNQVLEFIRSKINTEPKVCWDN